MAVVEPLVRTSPAAPKRPVAPSDERAVVRTAILNRLCAANDGTIVTIVAPAGYGKSTLLWQWAERDSREVLRIELLPEDDNPELLGALLEPLAHESGLLVLLDNLHVLRSRAALDAFARILGSAAPGTTIGLAARRPPQLPLARLRAHGRLLEIGSDDLALKGRDGETLIRRAGVLLPRPEATALAERFEGWPAALFLATLSLRNGAHVSAIGGDDRYLADFLETEHLSSLSSAQRQFAARTSVLEQLDAETCDSLLERSDSRRVLDALESAGVVVPLDNQRRRYRYPCVVREYLCAELGRSDPERARALHRVAAARAAESGAIEEAIRHAAAADELADVAAFADLLAVSACGRGRLDLLEPWLDLLRDDVVVESHPDLCIAASWLYALRGRTADAQHWSDAATRGLKGSDARLHVLRALRCRDGADQMLDDANAACQKLPAGHAWRPAAVLARGTALLLAAETGKAESELVEAIELATAAGATELAIVGLCLRALLAATENERADAEAFTNEAVSIASVEPPAASVAALMLAAVEARNSARGDDVTQAASGLEQAEPLLDLVTPAVPWLGAVALLELVQVRLALAEADEARALLRRVADILRVRPRLGIVVQRSAELDRRTRALAEPEGRWASSLTPAERRLLPLLATHLSFREIGERLYVSRNTVKTQAIAVYRKFGVTSRSAAIERAVELGLIEEAAAGPQAGLWCAN
jgi:LuxR family transcriptional regulator, maltose regulon positive regulatory protein